jgi:TetR/AcrR family transcriptional regulator, transcriptional repressor for nem operon
MNMPNAMAASLLDAAELTIKAVGYNGLSFRDLAATVGIKSASVHYHFPSKARLGAAVARRYTDRLIQHLGELDSPGSNAEGSFAGYIAVFRTTLEQDGRMCLCGILAAETDAIPTEVQAEVRRFVDLNVSWILSALVRTTGTHRPTEAVQGQAMAIFAALEGAMLVARGTGNITNYDAIVAEFVSVGLIPR